jgi:hypothetical protein
MRQVRKLRLIGLRILVDDTMRQARKFRLFRLKIESTMRQARKFRLVGLKIDGTMRQAIENSD